jgi:serine phosphatase RsbU (regulator of sigma subunit)/anti-sigma regulatory factor (Ser/Thr protein kinase)/CHASE3 domain sensor protein
LRLVRSKIQSQAILLSIVPLAFLLVFLAVVALLVDRTAEMTIWTQQASRVLDQSDAILPALGDASRAAVDYGARRNAAALKTYRLSAGDVRRRTQELLQSVQGPAQRVQAENYAGLVGRGLGVLDAYVADMRSGQTARARALVAAPAARAVNASIPQAKASFDRAARQLTSSRFRALRDQIRTYGFILLILTFAGIILTLFTTGRFGINIARRLRLLAENADRLGSGQTTAPVHGDDEIADLDRIYHEMAQRIHDTLSAYRREHYIASTLQRALLPQEMPRVPGLRIDTAYAAAAHAAEIGGDWYDVFKLDEGLVGISVGDVAGHGLRAAAIMGSVRQAIRAAARFHSEPATVLNRANRALCADEADVIVTAFFATIDMRNGKTRYAVAGHPLPLIVHSGTQVEQLTGEGLILGVDAHASFRTFERDLRIGEGIVGFTDGLIEIERDYFKGMENLIETVKSEYGSMPSENIAEHIKDRILANAEPADDSAVLFVGITNLGMNGSPQEQTWKVNARERGAAYRVRRAVLWDLAARAMPGSDLAAVELILGELLSNVAQHTPGDAEITMEFRDGRAVLRVRDEGKPFATNGEPSPDPMSPSGRGLHLIRSLARSIELENNGSGNTVAVVLPVHIS